MQNLDGLVVFARVVEAQSFSEAARRLGMSPSMVSKQVSKLERSLGARLLNRTTRKLSVTEVGNAVYEHCARIAREADEIDVAVAQLHAAPRGRLKLSAPANFGMFHVAPLLAEYMSRYPEVTVELTLNDRVAVDLADDALDAALIIVQGTSQNVIARRLAPIRWVLCASPAYLSRQGEPQSVEDLSRHNCLIYPELYNAGAWRFRKGDEILAANVRGNLIVNSSLAIREATVAGLGIAVLPTYLCGEELRNGILKALLLQYQPFTESVLEAIYLPGRPLPAKLTRFLEFCLEKFGPRPYWDEGF